MNENKGFIPWIRKYPTKFMILIFLVFIPLILIFTALIINVRNNHRFYFELNENNEPVYLYRGDLTKESKLSELIIFDLKLESIVEPKEQVNTGSDETTYINGEYIFNFRYSTPENVYASFQFEALLDTTFNGYRSSVKAFSFFEENEDNKMVLPYNYVMPYKKNIFTTVDRPYLFLKITVNSSTIIEGLPLDNEIYYVKFDLNNQRPDVRPA